MSDDVSAHLTADSRGQWFVLTDADDLGDAQLSGRWIKTTEPVELDQ